MTQHTNVQHIDSSLSTTKPLLLWLTVVVVSLVCTVLLSQPNLYIN
jgi:hypothetical protein